MKEKHVPLREYLKSGESINDPEKFYKDARPKTAAPSLLSQPSNSKSAKKHDFNMYPKRTN